VFRTLCPSCHHVYKITEENVNKIVPCSKCNFNFLIERLKNENPIPIEVQIGINKKKINENNIDEILEFHKKNVSGKDSITNYLLKKNIINENDLGEIVLESRALDDKYFMKTVLDEGIISKEDITDALKFQKKSNKKGGQLLIKEVMVKLGFISKKQLERMYTIQVEERKKLFELEVRKELKKDNESSKANKKESSKANKKKSPDNKQKSVKDVIPNNDSYDYGEELSLCKFGVEKKFFTQEHLDKAVSLKESSQKTKTLIEILVTENSISAKQALILKTVKMFGETRNRDNIFGQTAVKKEIVKIKDVKSALNSQLELYKNDHIIKSIDEILIEEGLLSDENRKIILEIIEKDDLSNKSEDVDPDNFESYIKQDKKNISVEELTIDITEDNLIAYIYLPENRAEIKLAEIKEMLELNDVVYGITSDEVITNCLTAKKLKINKFVAAKGEDSVEGKNGTVKYHFNTDYLTAGEIKEDGSIDFKERGETPHVKNGDIIAVKTPPIHGEHGKDIFGNEILSSVVNDPTLRPGSGVALSEDKLSVVSVLDGRPDLSVAGILSVFNEMIIPGNVDYKSGNIDFKGNIFINGTIIEGFSVQGVNITTDEISGAMARVSNDFNVSGGIIESEVFVEGSTQAMFVSKSRLFSFGDVIISKEIFDSEIYTSGKCIIERGSIVNSKIFAKKGVEALQVGNERTKPCKISVGVDTHITAAVDLYNLEIESYEEKNRSLQRIIKSHTKNIEEILEKLDKGQKSQDKKNKKIEECNIQIDTENKEEISNIIETLEDDIKNIKKSAEDDLKKKNEYDEIIKDSEKNIEIYLEKIKNIIIQRDGSVDWSKKQSSISEMRVFGTVFFKTLVFTKNSRVLLDETQRVCTVKEINNKLRYESKERIEKCIPDYDVAIISEQKKFSK
jgi:uncharacterized protein (DUF342 family)